MFFVYYSGAIAVHSHQRLQEHDVSSPSTVSLERIRSMLAGRDLNYGDYADSELLVPTSNAIFLWDTSNPQILQLRAHWRGTAEDDAQFVTLTHEVATCNTTRTGPKAYLAPFEDGTRYGLIAECNVVASSGLTEAQLDAFCETSMEMILSFFHDLELAHPEMVTWSDNTQGAQA